MSMTGDHVSGVGGSTSVAEHKRIVDDARIMRLRGGPVTDDAGRRVDALYNQIVRTVRSHCANPRRRSFERQSVLPWRIC
jgi:hypothetical protein